MKKDLLRMDNLSKEEILDILKRNYNVDVTQAKENVEKILKNLNK